MFKQFVDKAAGVEMYLIVSLVIFLVFFILVGLLLIKMNKKHIQYMSALPISEPESSPFSGKFKTNN
ncbi:MAG TPA: hypothetical protein VEV16_09770 [Daejeonella sp.]|nr:hypothetical protein [Daejeonella sp.]